MKWIGRAVCLMILLLLSGSMSIAVAAIVCDCESEACICFIQQGDEGIAVDGIVELLAEQGLLSTDRIASYDESVYHSVCFFQVEKGLEVSGVMDDDTLTALIWGVNAEVLDSNAPDSIADAVWVPTDGGKKRHSKPTCSGMYDPRKMSVRNAQALGIEACKKCKPK